MEVERLNPSLVRAPTEWGKRKEPWRSLTSGGLLLRVLKDCLREPESEAELKQVLDHLTEWKEFVSDPSNFRAGEHQWRTAQELVNLALRASTQPRSPSPEAQPIDRIFFEPELGAWQWDAMCALQSTPRIAVRDTNRSISVLMEQGTRGYLARLDVELIGEGSGEIYPAPESNWYIEFHQSTFLKALENAWDWVRRDCDADEQQKLQKVDARFRLERTMVPGYAAPELDVVSGNSAQAAMYLCLQQCANAYLGGPDAILMDPSVAVSATVQANLRLGGVDGDSLTSKIEAAYKKGLALVIVAKDDAPRAERALESAIATRFEHPHDSAIEILGCEATADALKLLRDRAREKEAVRRHEHERCRELNLFDQSVPIENHYQVLPLLQEVKKEQLLRANELEAREVEGGPFTGLRDSKLHRSEEAMREQQIVYEQHPLAKVFADFHSIAKSAKSTHPRFIVVGLPGSGKTTLAQFLAWACGAPRNNGTGNEAVLRLREASGLAANLVPARVTLRDWESWAKKSKDPEPGLPKYLAKQYLSIMKTVRKGLTVGQAENLWLNWLHRGEVLLLLDGLDEIDSKEFFVKALKQAITTFTKVPDGVDM